MFSESGFNIFVIGTFVWFILGAGVVGVFGIRDAIKMFRKDK